MRFWTEKWGITEEEWKQAHTYYSDLGERVSPSLETLRSAQRLVGEERPESALHLLCYSYKVPSIPLIRAKEAKDKVTGEFLVEERQIILYPIAFKKEPIDLLAILLHEFGHYLQDEEYPFKDYDPRIGEMYEKSKVLTHTLREGFARTFTEASMAKLGWVYIPKG